MKISILAVLAAFLLGASAEANHKIECERVDMPNVKYRIVHTSGKKANIQQYSRSETWVEEVRGAAYSSVNGKITVAGTNPDSNRIDWNDRQLRRTCFATLDSWRFLLDKNGGSYSGTLSHNKAFVMNPKRSENCPAYPPLAATMPIKIRCEDK